MPGFSAPACDGCCSIPGWRSGDRLGKLPVGPAPFRDRMIASGAEILAVSDAHAIETAALPRHHDDPFDRMLIAQARVEKLRAVSADQAWRDYELDLAVI